VEFVGHERDDGREHAQAGAEDFLAGPRRARAVEVRALAVPAQVLFQLVEGVLAGVAGTEPFHGLGDVPDDSLESREEPAVDAFEIGAL